MIKSYTKHVYNVDAVTTFFKLKELVESGPELTKTGITKSEYIERLQFALEAYLKFEKHDIEVVLTNKLPIVVRPTNGIGQYESWMTFQLMITNHRLIPLMLDYHFQQWRHDSKFLDILEFHIIPMFDSKKPTELTLATDTIYHWLRSERKKQSSDSNVTKRSYDGLQVLTAEEIEEFDTLDIIMKPAINIKKELIDDLTEYIATGLQDPNQKEDLRLILQGKKPNNQCTIEWNRNYFGFVMYRLKEKDPGYILESDMKLAEWFSTHILFYDKETGKAKLAGKDYLKKCIDCTRRPIDEDVNKIKVDIDNLLKKLAKPETKSSI
jgi:hypothetical protein